MIDFILQQVNDTKSAYSQISDLVNAQFVPDNVSLSPHLQCNIPTKCLSTSLNIIIRQSLLSNGSLYPAFEKGGFWYFL